MKPKILLSVFACIFFTAQALAAERYEKTPEGSLVLVLRGATAECFIRNLLSAAELDKPRSSNAINVAPQNPRQCLDELLPKGEAKYRSVVQEAPASKTVLTKVYAAWLTHMESLAEPLAAAEQTSAEAGFELAVGEVWDELDAR